MRHSIVSVQQRPWPEEQTAIFRVLRVCARPTWQPQTLDDDDVWPSFPYKYPRVAEMSIDVSRLFWENCVLVIPTHWNLYVPEDTADVHTWVTPTQRVRSRLSLSWSARTGFGLGYRGGLDATGSPWGF